MNDIEFKKQLKKLPAKPGIYLFSAKGGSQPEAGQPLAGAKHSGGKKYLYIGKALNLKNRVKNYSKTTDPRLIKMLAEAKKIDFIQTESDIEALILESQYIKRYQPTFNIMLRDDKQYGFVGFTDEPYSKVFITHQPNKIRNSNIEIRNNYKIQNSKFKTISDFGFRASDLSYIGPFTDMGALKTTLRLLRKIFPYCTCRKPHNNYCLNYHIGKCAGFCCLKNPELRITNYELLIYKNNIKAIKHILSGKKSSLIKNLEKEMKDLSSRQEFEKAMELQYKIEKLKRVFQNAQIIQNTRFNIQDTKSGATNKNILKELAKVIGMDRPPLRIEAYDIANIQGKHAVGAMAVFIDGKPARNEYRKFKIYTKSTPDDTAMLQEILVRRFRHPEWAMPDLIIVDGGKTQLSATLKVISNLKFKIPIVALTKKEKHVGHKITKENGEEISLSKLPTNVKNLLLQIDSEAHRFAINYYRQLHRKRLT